ncbi:MAG TPA: amidase [Chloroflexota bacterium]
MRFARPLLAGLLLSVSTAEATSAQVVGPSVSITIVEPRAQDKWGFAPTTTSIAPGTWVTWSNDGQDAHTVTADDGTFDSGNLDPSEGFAWYFAQAGTWQYTCSLHPWMAGTIVVADASDDEP